MSVVDPLPHKVPVRENPLKYLMTTDVLPYLVTLLLSDAHHVEVNT